MSNQRGNRSNRQVFAENENPMHLNSNISQPSSAFMESMRLASPIRDFYDTPNSRLKDKTFGFRTIASAIFMFIVGLVNIIMMFNDILI